MKHKMKQHQRILAGVLLAATLLTIPVTAAVLGEEKEAPSAHVTEKAPADEEPYLPGNELLIFDDESIDRGQERLVGIEFEPGDTEPESLPSLNPSLERELIEKIENANDNRLSEVTKREAAAALERERKLAEEKAAAAAKREKHEAERKKAETPTETEVTKPTDVITEESSPSGDTRFLLQISHPDPNYKGRPLQVSDRATLEGLVMGEWGNDYIGAVLVAQCIRDSMVKEGTNSAAVIKRKYGYTAPIRKSVSNTVKQAVTYVFDEGGSGVQHPIYYFYASNLVRGRWHETQKFIVQRKAVRFFSSHR
jgi:hypothetical protein